MKPALRIVLPVLAGALMSVPWVAKAQGMWGYPPYPSNRPEFYLGASIGSSFFPDQTNNTASWFNSAYNAMAPQPPGNYIATGTSQDAGYFGAKGYVGSWITPNVGVEVGYTYLGQIGWSSFSSNATGSFAVANSGIITPRAWYESVLLGVNSMGVRVYLKGGAYQASTNIENNGLNLNTGVPGNASQSVTNNGALAGIGISTTYYHTMVRLEVEDYVNVGVSSMPTTSQIPPWRGSIVLLSAGVGYVF